MQIQISNLDLKDKNVLLKNSDLCFLSIMILYK